MLLEFVADRLVSNVWICLIVMLDDKVVGLSHLFLHSQLYWEKLEEPGKKIDTFGAGVLAFSSVQKSDEGRYVCVAENDFGIKQ